MIQLPAIKRAKELGYYVGVADYDDAAVGIKYVDEYFNVSTIDVEGITEVAKSFKANGIMTIGTDMPMRAIAKATTELGLPGISYETAVKATDKGEMIKAFKKHGAASPWYYIVKDSKELDLVSGKLKYPCIIKPTDNAGSRGVILVNEPNELDSAYEYSRENSREGLVIIEEYMIGQEVSVEVLCNDEKVHILAITDKVTTGPPYFVEIGHSQPSQLKAEDIKAIKRVTKDGINALDINTGAAHAEIILTEDGPKIIEIGARMGGGFIASHLVPFSTGVDMIEASIRLSCNETIDVNQKIQRGSAMLAIPSKSGRLVKVHGVEGAGKLKGVREIIISKKEGDFLPKLENGSDRLGYIISQGDTAQEAIKICKEALKEIKIEIE